MRWVDEVKNRTMTLVVTRILVKLAHALDRNMAGVCEKGKALAASISALAVGWGNELAHYWRFDLGFQSALGMSVTSLS